MKTRVVKFFHVKAAKFVYAVQQFKPYSDDDPADWADWMSWPDHYPGIAEAIYETQAEAEIPARLLAEAKRSEAYVAMNAVVAEFGE